MFRCTGLLRKKFLKIHFDKHQRENLDSNINTLYQTLKSEKIIHLKNFEKIQNLELNNLQLRGLKCSTHDIFEETLKLHYKNKNYQQNLKKLHFLDKLIGLSIEIFEKTNEGKSIFTNDQNVPEFMTPIEFYSQIGQEYQFQFRLFLRIIITSTASYYNSITYFKSDKSFLKNLLFYLSFPYFLINKTAANLKTKEFHQNATVETGKQFWNSLETGLPKYFMKLINPRISISKTIEIPYKGEIINIRLLSPSSDLTQFKNVIFSIHGGGYVAMSSESHEYYLRNWSNQLNTPIFSVDYSLSPQSKFPVALNECYYAYQWMIKNDEYIKRIEKIIITGDSAGGNLAFGVMNKCIENNFRIPDAIMTCYPSTNVSLNFSFSRLVSLIDPLLNISMLPLLLKAYQNSEHNIFKEGKNFFLSPSETPKDIISKYPPTFISVGSLDPLLDDSISISNKLEECNVPVYLNVYDGIAHGYLHLYKIVPQAKKANDEILQWMKQIFENK
eukprot:gene8829-778_t